MSDFLGIRTGKIDLIDNRKNVQIVIEGQQQGIFREEFTTLDVTRAYAVFERGLMYDWCISRGNYSLAQYSAQLLPQFLKGFCKED